MVDVSIAYNNFLLLFQVRKSNGVQTTASPCICHVAMRIHPSISAPTSFQLPPAPTSAFHSFPAERERGLAVVSDGRSLEKSLILVLDEFAGGERGLKRSERVEAGVSSQFHSGPSLAPSLRHRLLFSPSVLSPLTVAQIGQGF